MYTITSHTRTQAKRLNVVVKPSTNKGKKIDVYKSGKKVASVGAIGYGDFGTFKKTKGNEYANERRRLYRIRHNKTAKKIGSNSYYAYNLLW